MGSRTRHVGPCAGASKAIARHACVESVEAETQSPTNWFGREERFEDSIMTFLRKLLKDRNAAAKTPLHQVIAPGKRRVADGLETGEP